MKIGKIFTLTLLSIFSLFALSNGYAQELLNQEQITESSFEKIYISPDRILIYPEGIFYLNEAGDVAPARLITSDASGLYIVAAAYQCPACRRWNRNNICNNPDCPLYGQ